VRRIPLWSVGEIASAARIAFEHSAKRTRFEWRRLLRVRATPHEIALGCAAGVFAACTPFLGFQMLLAAALALVLRVSIPAAFLGTFFGNPLSWPAIWTASYVTGAWMLGRDTAAAAEAIAKSADKLNATFLTSSPDALNAALKGLAPVIEPLIVGGMLVGLIAAVGSYYPTRRAVRVFQSRHHRH